MIIDKVVINGNIYYNVEVEATTSPPVRIEVTTGGFNGCLASDVREYRPGLSRSELIINIPEDQLK